MNIQDVRTIFNKNRNDIGFVIGNGINYHFLKDSLSWKELLLDLWRDHSFETQTTIPNGITFTEFYDALEIQNYNKKNFSSLLQKEVKRRMINWVPNSSQNILLNRIKELNSPILTTNFDDLIPKSLNLEFRKMSNTRFTDYYPWSCYYSDEELDTPTQGFGVWFPNGMIKYHRSIKLGLSQYMGNVERARKLIYKKPENISFDGENQNFWEGYNTWLHIIFNKSLFIIGLGLDEAEVFIRWLLIERAKYFRKFPNRKHQGWYIMSKEGSSYKKEGKKFFLRSVGFDIIELDTFNDIYEEIWK